MDLHHFGKPVPDPHQSPQQSEKWDPASDSDPHRSDVDPQHFFYMNITVYINMRKLKESKGRRTRLS
jgi:hypothetical protein